MSSAERSDDRWPSTADKSSTLTLPDERQLGYAQFGDPSGQPIFWMHGFPGSRLEVIGVDEEARKVGARIIAIDRPGYGLSTRHENRTLLDLAADVENLADHLDVPRFGVIGISGGGPYALACAKAISPEKLRAVAIVCGIGPPDMGYGGMEWFHWVGWAGGARMFPSLMRWWFGRGTTARLDLDRETRLKKMKDDFEKAKKGMHEKDVATFGDDRFMRMDLLSAEQIYRQGTDGLMKDFKVLNSDFGFKIRDIRKDLSVEIWHGTLDTFVPSHHAIQTAARIGKSASLHLCEETHASIWANLKEDWLGGLMKTLKDSGR